MTEYMTVREAADRWGVTARSVQLMCADGKIEGAAKFGRDWAIPQGSQKPRDARVTTGRYRGFRREHTRTGGSHA